MNKRSLFFIIALSVSFVILNNVIFPPKRVLASAMATATEIDAPQNRDAIAIDKLPVVTLYSDQSGQEEVPVTAAIQVGNSYILFAPSDVAPDALRVKATSGPFKTERLILQTKNHKFADPIIYTSENETSAPLQVAKNLGTSPVQLVYFSEDGIFASSTSAKPFQNSLQLAAPVSRAFVLVPFGKSFIPYGVYEASELSPLTKYRELKGSIAVSEIPVIDPWTSSERFYVLENGSMQLVFSNIGGAVAEINLPTKNKTHPNSPILPIEFDERLSKNQKENATFPLRPALKAGSDTPVSGTVGGYYPLLRREQLAEPRNAHGPSIFPPKEYAFALRSYDEEAPSTYKCTKFTANSIEFQLTTAGRRITKTYTLQEAPNYCVNLTVKVEGGDSRRLYLTSGVPEVEMISGTPAPILKYRITKNAKGSVEKMSMPKEDKDSVSITSIAPDWICNSNGFFGIIIDDLTEKAAGFTATALSGISVPTRLTLIDSEYDLYPAKKFPGYQMAVAVPAKETTYRIFAGPLQEDVLESVDRAFTDEKSGYHPDYSAAQSYHGWFSFISAPFASLLFVIMKGFHLITHSWGFSIILLTVVLRLMLYPLNNWSFRSMIKMQQIAPEVAELQKKLKADPKAAQLAVMQLYKERGVNPFGGCLPILIQMPFLIGMFDLLKSSFELRGASFVPGWIPNLTAPDVLFHWSYPIPFIGTEFHLLPILLGGVMFLQQRISSNAPKDANLMTDQQRQQRGIGNVMVVVFSFMFYSFPSGLNIYWLSSMLLGILQQWMMMRKMNPQVR